MSIVRGFVAAFLLVIVMVSVPSAFGAIIQFDLSGKGGTGLLSTNENGTILGTPGSGGEIGAGIAYDDVTNLLSINVGWGSGNGFTNLSGTASGMHIHGPTANPAPAGFLDNAGVRIGLDSLPGFNSSASSGGFSGTVTLDATQETELLAQRSYINVHTGTNPGGEIRGHLVVPEPGSFALIGCAALALTTARRRRRTP